MNTQKTIITLIISAIIVLPCLAEKKKKEAKVEYEFPTAMIEPVRVEYTKQCDKGQALYSLACASCHNKIVNGKTIIPDFSEAELEAYRIRVANAKHETEVSEERVNAEELAQIMTFLTYKKKNGLGITK